MHPRGRGSPTRWGGRHAWNDRARDVAASGSRRAREPKLVARAPGRVRAHDEPGPFESRARLLPRARTCGRGLQRNPVDPFHEPEPAPISFARATDLTSACRSGPMPSSSMRTSRTPTRPGSCLPEPGSSRSILTYRKCPGPVHRWGKEGKEMVGPIPTRFRGRGCPSAFRLPPKGRVDPAPERPRAAMVRRSSTPR